MQIVISIELKYERFTEERMPIFLLYISAFRCHLVQRSNLETRVKVSGFIELLFRAWLNSSSTAIYIMLSSLLIFSRQLESALIEKK